MKLDRVNQVVTIISVVFGIVVSIFGLLANSKANSLEKKIKDLEASEKSLDITKKAYEASPNILARFELPLARSFAEEYLSDTQNVKFIIPTAELSSELHRSIPNWKERRGLMTGKPCEQQGLKARQIITLLLKNIGYADAVDISITAKHKASPRASPLTGWQDSVNNAALAYCDLHTAAKDWNTITFSIDNLYGQIAPEKDRNEIQVVLASVSGSTTFYGTVLVPIEISWTDKMTNKRQTQQIMNSQITKVRSALVGAEIGSLNLSCQ